jgi:hypothetical protein
LLLQVAEFLSSKGKLVANGVANGHTNGAPPSGSFYAFDQHSVIKYVQSKVSHCAVSDASQLAVNLPVHWQVC